MKIIALYSRLSVGDENRGNEESNSIKHQKLLLEEYASNRRLLNIRHYVDDDVSGRFFDRPAYNQLMYDVSNGMVEAVIVKDLSRWGRDHVQVSLSIEELLKKKVRFIAVNDNTDSFDEDSMQFAPIRNYFNEFHVIETSKKIRATMRVRGNNGKKLLTNAPYGYIKDPANKDNWLIDDEAAANVRYIFQLSMEGNGINKIATILREKGIMKPGAYLQSKGKGQHLHREFKDPYKWTNDVVKATLERREYVGDTINFKTTKHLKDKHCTYRDPSQHVIFEDTHPAIISRSDFATVQNILANKVRRVPKQNGRVHPLSSMLYCKDCGGKLHIHRFDNMKKRPTAICSNYATTRSREFNPNVDVYCPTAHRVQADNVLELLQATIRHVAEFVNRDKQAFVALLEQGLGKSQSEATATKSKRVTAIKSRLVEIDTILVRVFEENALGRMTENQYRAIYDKNSSEQERLKQELQTLQLELHNHEGSERKIDNFLTLIEEYMGFEELTQTMINKFVNKIVIHERDERGSKNSPQTIDIHFNHIGFLTSTQFQAPAPAPLTEAERLAQEKRAKKKAYQATWRANNKERIQANDKKRAEKQKVAYQEARRQWIAEQEALETAI